MDFAAVSGIGFDRSCNGIQGVQPAGCRHGHIVIGLADANQIDQTQIIGPARELKQRSDGLQLRFRFAFSSNLGGSEFHSYTPSLLAFDGIMSHFISDEMGVRRQRDGSTDKLKTWTFGRLNRRKM